jgi:hypothetical protein
VSALADGEDIDVIGELRDEHDRIRALSRELVLAAKDDDLEQARYVAQMIQELLAPLGSLEADALFPSLSDKYPDQIAALVAEHMDIVAVLAGLEQDEFGWCWPDTAIEVVDRLVEHMRKKRDAVFPAAISALSAAEWEVVAQARIASRDLVADASPAC